MELSIWLEESLNFMCCHVINFEALNEMFKLFTSDKLQCDVDWRILTLLTTLFLLQGLHDIYWYRKIFTHDMWIRNWKNAVLKYLKVLSKHCLDETKQTTWNFSQEVSQSRFKAGTSWIQIYRTSCYTNLLTTKWLSCSRSELVKQNWGCEIQIAFMRISWGRKWRKSHYPLFLGRGRPAVLSKAGNETMKHTKLWVLQGKWITSGTWNTCWYCGVFYRRVREPWTQHIFPSAALLHYVKNSWALDTTYLPVSCNVTLLHCYSCGAGRKMSNCIYPVWNQSLFHEDVWFTSRQSDPQFEKWVLMAIRTELERNMYETKKPALPLKGAEEYHEMS
jgi:hypothetical protein